MEEFKVRLAPKVADKKLSIFKMHKDDHVPWAEAKMKRDNEYQPWQIKTGSGKASKRFKASKQGSVDENSDFFIFYKPKGSSNTYEVCPIDEFYNVAADKRYKTLTTEEAEEQFARRDKLLNLDNLMRSMNKNSDTGEEGSSGGGSRLFKISEMDDWQGSDDDFSGSENGNADEEGAKKKSKKRFSKKEKDATDDAPEEGKEDSDEGDFEQREVDYMSESSSDPDESEKEDRDNKDDVKGIGDEQALRELLDSDEEEEEDVEGSPDEGTKSAAVRNGPEFKRDPEGANGSEESSDNDDDDDEDYDEDEVESMLMKKRLPAGLVNSSSNLEVKPKLEPTSATSSASQPSTSSSQRAPAGVQQGSAPNKRKLAESGVAGPSTSNNGATTPPKRPCPPAEPSSSSLPNSIERIIEDLIKKYLRRKPMTLKTLLRDIKSKLKRMNIEDLDISKRIPWIAEIIKKMNPEKQKTGEDLYFFLKS